MTAEDVGRELGFTGMVQAGASPAEAWAQIRAELAGDPDVLRLILGMPADALDASRQRWAAHGFAPPWEGLDPPGAAP